MGVSCDLATGTEESAERALRGLRVQKLRFFLRAEEPISLPAFAASALRGAFGSALKRAVCFHPTGDCAACRLRAGCAYPYLFETPRADDAERLRGARDVPRPYRIDAAEVPRRVPRGATFGFDIDLFGRATERASLVILAAARMAARGLGADRGRAVLLRARALGRSGWRDAYKDGVVHDIPPVSVLERTAPLCAQDAVTIEFASPVRLRFEGRLLTREIPFHVLARNLLRRLSSLLEFHEGVRLQLDYRRAIDAAAAVRVVSERLRRRDRWRFSGRQNRVMNLSGLEGTITYAGDVRAFEPWLRAGEVCGVGKGTTFGLGRMRCVRPPLDAARAGDE